MALTCPVDLDVATFRDEIRTMYTRVAMGPAGDFHFRRRPEYAAARLGYDQHELAQLPTSVTAALPASEIHTQSVRSSRTSSSSTLDVVQG